MSEDQGLSGVVAFRFECRRSGNCCTVPDGYVWLQAGESERMAAALGIEVERFAERYLRQVADPESGELRWALRDGAEGRCGLLEGHNHCTVYGDRPDHCRRFPYWKSVMRDPEAFERARAICPGIEQQVGEESRARAFAALEALYREVDGFVDRAEPVCILRGRCCRFEEVGHRLYATGLEVDYAAAKQPVAESPEGEGRCPYHVKGRCTAREGRPLGCRTYFCDTRTSSVLEEAHEHFLARIRHIEAETGYPHSYGSFPERLAARIEFTREQETP